MATSNHNILEKALENIAVAHGLELSCMIAALYTSPLLQLAESVSDAACGEFERFQDFLQACDQSLCIQYNTPVTGPSLCLPRVKAEETCQVKHPASGEDDEEEGSVEELDGNDDEQDDEDSNAESDDVESEAEFDSTFTES
jgi:hypothetical protein